MIGLAWKYGRSFLEATIRENVIFSIHGESLADVIHQALYPIFFLDQGCADRSYGHN